eukprot:2693807-Prymnesium_polylepis.1
MLEAPSALCERSTFEGRASKRWELNTVLIVFVSNNNRTTVGLANKTLAGQQSRVGLVGTNSKGCSRKF